MPKVDTPKMESLGSALPGVGMLERSASVEPFSEIASLLPELHPVRVATARTTYKAD